MCFHSGFAEEATAAALRTRLDAGDVGPLTLLLCEGLLPRLTRLAVLALETREPLMELPELAARISVKESALRKRIERGALLAIKHGKRVYRHQRRPSPAGSHALARRATLLRGSLRRSRRYAP